MNFMEAIIPFSRTPIRLAALPRKAIIPSMISVVFPAYNEEAAVAELHRAVVAALSKTGKPFEIVAVDDGSTDGTLEALKKLSPIRIVSLAWNSGQTYALDAGFKAAKGEVIVTLDADLQNDPEDIPRLTAKLEEGYDVVSGLRTERHDPLSRRILSGAANGLTAWVTGLPLKDLACGLKAYRADILKELHLHGELHVLLPALLSNRGARIAELPVAHRPRTSGHSKHSFLKAVRNLGDLAVLWFLTRRALRPILLFGGASAFLLAGAAACGLAAVFCAGPSWRPALAVAGAGLGAAALQTLLAGFLAELLVRIYFDPSPRAPYRVRGVIENA